MNARCSCTGSKGRFLVGDEQQAIYRFSGAARDGLRGAITSLTARELALTVTFRCPRSHVELARPYGQRIEAVPNAKHGRIVDTTDAEALPFVQASDLIICRTNGPLVRMVLKLAQRGMPVKLLGRDLQKDLLVHLNAAFDTPFHVEEVRLRP